MHGMKLPAQSTLIFGYAAADDGLLWMPGLHVIMYHIACVRRASKLNLAMVAHRVAHYDAVRKVFSCRIAGFSYMQTFVISPSSNKKCD